MENIPFLWLARWAMAFLVAYILVRKIRNLLLKIILRLMPARHRFSATSFEKGAKWVNIIGMLLIGGLATLFSLAVKQGASWAKASLFPAPVVEYETAPPPLLLENENTAMTNKPEKPNTPTAVLMPTTPTVPTVEVKTAPLPTRPIPITDPHFIQLHAYADIRNARRQRQRMWPQKTWIGMVENEAAPFKLLIGPYAYRATAEQARKTQRLKGFSRPLADVAFFIE